MDNSFVQFVLIPLAIFCSRITDVSIGTMRIILLARGNRLYVPFLGFFEVLLWLIVMVNVVKSLDHPIYYIAYAGGFATGNYVGMLIENRLAMGVSLLRIITALEATELVTYMRKIGYVVTEIVGHGNRGEVRILLTIVKRREIAHLVEIIRQYNPSAFYTIEDVGYVSTDYALALHKRKTFFDKFAVAKKK
ncbi:MAG: DUF2179 domain-containing protein [Calditrichaeota bacterium]|nr:MAG: DUF2179 domain-containing protein [Calditrichota bacterium]